MRLLFLKSLVSAFSVQAAETPRRHNRNRPQALRSRAPADPALSQDELIAQSSLIIKGTVSEVSDTFQVKPETGGDASSYVDNTVRMEQTLRGQTDADTVTVRVQDDDQASTEDAKLEQGKEYLLFLTASGEDNTYRVTGAMQGAYEVQADGTCVAWDGTKWTLQDAQKAIEQAK